MNENTITAAPSVLPSTIDALIASLTFATYVFPGTTLTVAAAFLPDGFAVALGESACVSPENFNADLGAKYAVDNARAAAREKLWELEGYVLKKQLAAGADLAAAPAASSDTTNGAGTDVASTAPASDTTNPGVAALQPHQQRVVDEHADLTAKTSKLRAFLDTSTFVELVDDEKSRLNAHLRGHFGRAHQSVLRVTLPRGRIAAHRLGGTVEGQDHGNNTYRGGDHRSAGAGRLAVRIEQVIAGQRSPPQGCRRTLCPLAHRLRRFQDSAVGSGEKGCGRS
jgi:hypothetical protein